MSNIVDLCKRVALIPLTAVTENPNYKYQKIALALKNTDDFPAISAEFQIPETLLREQFDAGFDIPSYRFKRDGAFFKWLVDNKATFKGMSWLDVGADRGCVSAYISAVIESTDMKLCDIAIQPKHNFEIQKFDGKSLDYEDKSFDIVLFSFVLHHASSSTIQLLKDARRISRKHVFVLEDPKETAQDDIWGYYHDKSGVFRSLTEWRALFDLLGFDVAAERALSPEVHSRHFFHLVRRDDS
jgi:SAM-dependent methyltransferase